MKRPAFAAILLTAQAACAGAGEATVAPSSPSVAPAPPAAPTTPAPAASRVELAPVDGLRAWLDATGAEPVVLPIVLTRGATGFDIGGARVGAGPDALVVYANDAALGIGLADRAGSACPGAERCAFVVEARFRGVVDERLEIDVMRVVSRVEIADAPTYAERAGSRAK